MELVRAALTRALPAALRLAQAGVKCLSSMRFPRGLLIAIGLADLLGAVIPLQEALSQHLA